MQNLKLVPSDTSKHSQVDFYFALVYLFNRMSADAEKHSKNFQVSDNKDGHLWLFQYLVFLYRACGKDETKFRLMIDGSDNSRAYIFRPNTFNSLYWKMNLVTLGKHHIRCVYPINWHYVVSCRFILLNLKPHNSGKVRMSRDKDDLGLPGVGQGNILDLLNKTHFIKTQTSSSEQEWKVMTKEGRKSLLQGFKSSMMEEAKKSFINIFVTKTMIDKTFVPCDYKFVNDVYKQLLGSEETEHVELVQKYLLGTNLSHKGPIQEFHWWLRFSLCALYSDFYSLFERDNRPVEAFLTECNFHRDVELSPDDPDIKEKFSLALLKKVTGHSGGAAWTQAPKVGPRLENNLFRMLFMASSGYWKMRNTNFEENALNEKKSNPAGTDTHEHFFPYAPSDQFEQLGIPLLRDVLYKSKFTMLVDEDRVDHVDVEEGFFVSLEFQMTLLFL